ncbi:MAG TPA: NAD-dependent epimerase/dehydratase family protein, partial [Phototrophicaceae bacterium]|nr:NAD-dependent epimerase/dehydratase family protein [Phototrophicaceae bacterium]
TVLVTGATGFLGGALARRLAADGAHVKALARRPNRDVYIRDIPNIELVTGDITNADRLTAAAQGCDYVFHVAAAMCGKQDYQCQLNVAGTRNVMQAAVSAQVQRFVHVSSIAVYGYGYTGDVAEAMLPRPGRVPYNITKAEGETVVQTIGQSKNVPYTIIRPGMIYGPRSGMWTETMFKLARRRPTIFVGDGGGHVHTIYVDDVVDLMVTAAAHPAAENEVFNCAPDPTPTWRQFLGGYAKLAGHQSWLGLPPLLVKIIAPLLEGLLTLTGEPQDIPALIPFATGKTTYKMDKARRLLGWQPQVSLEEGLRRCEPWLREKGLLV